MQTVTNISADVLKVHPRNTEFFDDISGNDYEQFKRSIQEDGVITPLTVAPDMTLISGHQRLKACKDLGIKNIPVIIREDLDNEDEKLKKLLAANFGRPKNNENKQRKVAVEYVKLCGIKHGTNKKCDNRISLEEIAEQLGTNKRTLQELLEIERKLTPELKEILDTGGITKTTASKILVKLSKEDQNALLEEIGEDRLKEMTQKQLQEYINKIKHLEDTVDEYKSMSQTDDKSQTIDELIEEKQELAVEKRQWYEKAEKYKKENEDKEKEIKRLKEEKEKLENREQETIEIEKIIEKIPDDYESIKRLVSVLTTENQELSKVSEERRKELEDIKFVQANKLNETPEEFVSKYDYDYFEEITRDYERLINPFLYMKTELQLLDENSKNIYLTKIQSIKNQLDQISNNIKGE